MLSTFNVRTRGQWGPQAPSADLTSPAPVTELGMQVCQVSKGRVGEEGKNNEKKSTGPSVQQNHTALLTCCIQKHYVQVGPVGPA